MAQSEAPAIWFPNLLTGLRTIRAISHHIQALFCHTISQLTAFSVHKFPGSDFSSRAIGLIKRELFTTRLEYCDDVFSCSYLVKTSRIKPPQKKQPCTRRRRGGSINHGVPYNAAYSNTIISGMKNVQIACAWCKSMFTLINLLLWSPWLNLKNLEVFNNERLTESVNWRIVSKLDNPLLIYSMISRLSRRTLDIED